MSQLIAMTTLAAIVDGKRTTIAVGESVPALSAHDTKELLAIGAIAEAKSLIVPEAGLPTKEFLDAKKAVADANASIATTPAPEKAGAAKAAKQKE